MSSVYTPTGAGNLVLAYTVPSDTDPRNAASVNVPLEGEADDIARLAAGKTNTNVVSLWLDGSYMLEEIEPGGTAFERSAYVRLSSRKASVWRQESISGVLDYNQNAIRHHCKLPHGASVTQVRAYLAPAGGHGALPVTVPKIDMVKYDPTTDTETSIFSVTDPSANVAAYEVAHNITAGSGINFTAFTIDRSLVYYVNFLGEFSTNAVASLILRGVQVTISTANTDPRAA